MRELTLLPVVSEKAMAQAEAGQTYSFLVPLSASKLEISEAVKKQFSVKVAAVNSHRLKGKAQATLVQRGSRRIKGQRSDVKKAVVKLEAGEKISLFEEKK